MLPPSHPAPKKSCYLLSSTVGREDPGFAIWGVEAVSLLWVAEYRQTPSCRHQAFPCLASGPTQCHQSLHRVRVMQGLGAIVVSSPATSSDCKRVGTFVPPTKTWMGSVLGADCRVQELVQVHHAPLSHGLGIRSCIRQPCLKTKVRLGPRRIDTQSASPIRPLDRIEARCTSCGLLCSWPSERSQ